MPDSPKNLYKKLLGRKGELTAEGFLKKQGFKILEKNYRTKFGEADLIVSKNGALVFVEVKTRSSLKFGTPAQAVNYDKQRRYREIASYYTLIKGLNETETEISFAVVEILGDSINLIENAF